MTKHRLDAEAVVRARMAEVGISQLRLSMIARKSQSWAAGRFLPYIERAAVALANSDPEALDRILVALRWSAEQFMEQTGIQLPVAYLFFSSVAETRPMDRASKTSEELNMYELPVRGLASAGKPVDTETFLVPKSAWRPGCESYRVEGDSMTTADPDSLRDGDTVLVDTGLRTLMDGKIFMVEIIGDGYCIKRARKLGSRWYLMSDNPDPRYPPLQPKEARVVGLVYEALGRRKV